MIGINIFSFIIIYNTAGIKMEKNNTGQYNPKLWVIIHKVPGVAGSYFDEYTNPIKWFLVKILLCFKYKNHKRVLRPRERY